jgi:hypothetical protein
MCLVRRFWLPNVANAMAPWLSIAIEIGGRLGSCMAGASGGSISASMFRSHVASRAASEAAIYSASHVNRATIGCLFDPQAMGPPAPRNKYPLVDLQVDVSPAQSESVSHLPAKTTFFRFGGRPPTTSLLV